MIKKILNFLINFLINTFSIKNEFFLSYLTTLFYWKCHCCAMQGNRQIMKIRIIVGEMPQDKELNFQNLKNYFF